MATKTNLEATMTEIRKLAGALEGVDLDTGLQSGDADPEQALEELQTAVCNIPNEIVSLGSNDDILETAEAIVPIFRRIMEDRKQVENAKDTEPQPDTEPATSPKNTEALETTGDTLTAAGNILGDLVLPELRDDEAISAGTLARQTETLLRYAVEKLAMDASDDRLARAIRILSPEAEKAESTIEAEPDREARAELARRLDQLPIEAIKALMPVVSKHVAAHELLNPSDDFPYDEDAIAECAKCFDSLPTQFRAKVGTRVIIASNEDEHYPGVIVEAGDHGCWVELDRKVINLSGCNIENNILSGTWSNVKIVPQQAQVA